MKNFKKKDSVDKCIVDPGYISCNLDNCCDDNSCDSVLINTNHNCLNDSCCFNDPCCVQDLVASGRGKIKNDDIDLEFTFNITDNHGCLCGDVAVADYNSNVLLSSSNLQNYTQCTPCSFCAVFCDCNETQTRYICVCGLKIICGNPPMLFIYSPPFCGVEEVNTGGILTEGSIQIANSECCC